ncbi:MAG: hypothetical protein H6895_05080 [Defluviimonas sp.]|nr:hypothetical protein [Defluviimonas sp.]
MQRTLVAAAGVAVLAFSPLAASMPAFGASAAYARNDKDHGNGGDEGTSRQGGEFGGVGNRAARAAQSSTGQGKNRDAIASELKDANAASVNPGAMAGAAPNSQVGRIAEFRDAALATIAAGESLDAAEAGLASAQTALADATAALEALDGTYDGRTADAIATDIAALDPAAADHQTALDAFNAEMAALDAHTAGRTAAEDRVSEAESALRDAATAASMAETSLSDAEAAELEALRAAANGRTLSAPAVDFIREQLGL